MSKILITGANGYIGRFLVGLLSTKHEVISFVDDLNRVNELSSCDLVIHCAGRKPREGVKIEDFIYSNVSATTKLCSLTKDIPIIYLSTMAVYVLKPYGITKLLGEKIMQEANDKSIVLRLPTIVNQGGDSDIVWDLNKLGEKILEIIDGMSIKG